MQNNKALTMFLAVLDLSSILDILLHSYGLVFALLCT